MSEKKVDYSAVDLNKTQEMMSQVSRMKNAVKSSEELKEKQLETLSALTKDEEVTDLIQKKLILFNPIEKLEEYLKGDLKDKTVQEHIDYFFTNDETGDVLELIDACKKSVEEEYDFKRGLLLYLQRSEYYIHQLDEEVTSMNKAMKELNDDISSVLDPLTDDILGYVQYLEQNSIIEENDTLEQIKQKKATLRKAKAIKNAYTLDNLIEMIEKHPSIVDNALKDFKKESNIKDIGRRYMDKLERNNIGFNLLPLLGGDDIKDSIEYKCLPIGWYSEELANFTVFFIIRYLAMGLNTVDDIVFHASVQVAFSRLLEGTLPRSAKETLQDNIKKLLSYFA